MRSPCFKCDKLNECKEECSARTCGPLREYQEHLDRTRSPMRAIDPASDSYSILAAVKRSMPLPRDL